MTFDQHGREVAESDQPATYALRTGRIVESTVLGFYNKRVRQLKWLSVTCVPQFAVGASMPEQVLSLFSDVTALKRDSTLFDRAQSLAHIGGWEWDTGRNSLYLTEEARRIHYGEAEPRGIYGQAEIEEARALLEEGIAVLPLPALPDERN